jgi:hypothetical protein
MHCLLVFTIFLYDTALQGCLITLVLKILEIIIFMLNIIIEINLLVWPLLGAPHALVLLYNLMLNAETVFILSIVFYELR